MIDDINNLAELWLKHKEAERKAIEDRRAVEDKIKEMEKLAEDFLGTYTPKSNFKIKISSRLNRKIDVAKLEDIVVEHNLQTEAGLLFRWQPEINTKLWDVTDKKIINILEQAITTKPMRASFSITTESGE